MYRCLLCHDPHVSVDDAATPPTARGTVICLRCWAAEVADERALAAWLRAAVHGEIRSVARDLFGEHAARCVGCGQSVAGDVLALLIAPVGWFCDGCLETPLARALIADEGLGALLTSKRYRCIVCEGETSEYGQTLNPLGLAICAACQGTEIGRKLNQDDYFRIRYLRALGLDQGKPAPPVRSPLDEMMYGGCE